MTETASISGVTKRYGARSAVDDVSFALSSGETVALVGHNGAGKTTLVKLLLGLAWPDGGHVRVMGENPARATAAIRRQIGFLPESVSFNMALTGRETLAFYARLKGLGPGVCDGLFETVGLAREAADRRIRTYSKGMRQRLGLAQALLGTPRLLLLDEPTSGLDPALRRHVYAILSELRAAGTAILLSSHALSELEERVDRVVVMNAGRKVAEGSLDALRRLARLPSRLTVRGRPGAKLEAGLPEVASGWHRAAADVFEARIEEEDSARLLPRLAACGEAIRDVAIVPPTLDDLYAHFLSQQAGRP